MEVMAREARDHDLKTQTEVGIPQSDKNNHHVTRL